MSNIAFFDEQNADDVSTFGGKAASLASLTSAGTIPPGFSISVEAFREWNSADSAGLPAHVEDEIRNAYEKLERLTSTINVPVAVRSSAIDEDGAEDSFAGIHDTFLNVIGVDEVLSSVIRCWKSVGSDQALEYRRANGLDTESAGMGVVVQQLVFSDVSAVAFSSNPISGNRNEILINANFGLGEAVVSGLTTPDSITVSRSDLSDHSTTIGSKELMTVRTENGTEEKAVPGMMRGMPVLSDEQITEIAELVINLETINGFPVDVELGFASSQLYLLQCRPITTLK